MYQRTILDNGLRVITHSMPAVESVALGIWIGTGGRYENKKITGISHFLEHLLFKGTKKRSTRQIKQSIEGVGGSLNAFTSEEVTCYFVKILGKHLSLSLDVLTDMVLNATLPPLEIEKERTVIIEEIKMYLDLPGHYVGELLDQLFWPNHPLGRFLAGSPETVTAIKRKDIKEYKDRFYNPRNIVIAVCGNVEHDRLLSDVNKYCSKLKPGVRGRFQPAEKGKEHPPQTHFYFKETEQTHLSLGVHAFKFDHPDKYILTLLHIILGANMSSRLFQEVRERRGLAYQISSHLKRYQDTGAFVVNAGVDNTKVSRAIGVILGELTKIANKDVTPGELCRAKEFCVGQLLLGLEDTMDYMLWIGDRESSRGKSINPAEIIKEVNKVSVADIRRVATKLFRSHKLNLALIGPIKDKGKKEIKKILTI